MMLFLRSKLRVVTRISSQLKVCTRPLPMLPILHEPNTLFLQPKRELATSPVVNYTTSLNKDVYNHEFSYLPSWRRINERMVESVTAHKHHLEVTFSGPLNDIIIRTETKQPMCTFAYHWLRDNCRCTQCFEHGALNKIHSLTTTSHLLHSGRVSADGRGVVLNWQDGHESFFPGKFLEFHCIESKHPRTDHVIDAERELWGSNVSEKRLKRFEFDDIMNDDEVLLEWLMDIRVLGISIIQNAPLMIGQIEKIGKRVAYLRPICFGTTFQVQVKPNASHVAFSSSPLPLHTDTTYYMDPMGIELFHCIKKSSSGGENILSDGFRAAEMLKQSDPEYFDVLTKVEWEYYDVGNDYLGQHHMQSRHPVIK